MPVLFRWLLRLFIALSALSIAGFGLAWYLAARSLPDYGRDHVVSGIIGPVEIVRDRNDIPHIFAEHDPDAYFGLGFAHAQDRLWQMTMLRRTAEGRLSELFGRRTLPIDDFMRRLDLLALSQTALAFQGPDAQAALAAYAAGVNAWLNVVRRDALGRGAPEFFLFSRRIRPWRPADSLAILRLMSLRQSGHLNAEILRARASLVLDDARLGDILPDAPGPGSTALPAYGQLFPGLPRFAASGTVVAAPDPLDPMPARALAGASNIWAAGPMRATTGSTLLANDPHSDLSAPSIWMLARLELAGGSVIGATIPGMPAVLAGRSENIGWGVASAWLDDQDIHIEKLNPDDAGEYLTPGGFVPFRQREVTIEIRGSAPINRVLQWTDNGPVLPATRPDIAAITPEGHVATLAWTGLDPQDRSMTGALRLMQAKNVTQAVEAGRLITTPAQNLIIADKDSIAFQMVGKMPDRPARHQSRGRLPSPGWLRQNRWQGYLPYENNPRIINPPGGILANTNNKTVDRPFPNHVSYVWGDTQRIERLQKLLGSREVHSQASFIETQLDEVSFSARALLPLIARDLWFADVVTEPGTKEALRRNALGLLAEWNGQMNEHMPEPLIYAAWMRELQKLLVQDELGPLARDFAHPDPVFLERVFRNLDGAAIWCDVAQSTRRETCTEIARQALDAAILQLVQDHGTHVESWRWGNAHQAVQDHEVLGTIPLLAWLVNIRQSTSGGDNTLSRGVTRGHGRNPYANVHGAGYRGVYDLADPDASVFVISTGQSGHFLSRHYDDLAQLWRRGEYVPMSLDPMVARAAAVGISHLTPKRN